MQKTGAQFLDKTQKESSHSGEDKVSNKVEVERHITLVKGREQRRLLISVAASELRRVRWLNNLKKVSPRCASVQLVNTIIFKLNARVKLRGGRRCPCMLSFLVCV